jgi:hypothetical protein
MKVFNATKHGEVLLNYFREELIFHVSSIPFLVPIFEDRVSIPHNGGIWIFNITKVESHRGHVFMHGIKKLFSYEDIKIVKSYVWRVGYDQYGKIQWKYEVLECFFWP